ncbi:unnamed protein product [Clonostachys rosea]|uniref:CBM-cenC domain-containing protein n=1 Tax=Bionectria ochroleuca TaxID=29856 RepID=A0ABY6UXB3_BIOOC|nr:unnamed protein product [Clonostachys rosea]
MVSQKYFLAVFAAAAGVAGAKTRCRTRTPSLVPSAASTTTTPEDHSTATPDSSESFTPSSVSVSTSLSSSSTPTPETSISSTTSSDSTPVPGTTTDASTPSLESQTSTPLASSDLTSGAVSTEISTTPTPTPSTTSTSILSTSVPATTSAPAAPSDCNVVDDPGFEAKGSGQASSWVGQGGGFYAGSGYTGYGFRANLNEFNTRSTLSQTLSGVKANGLYRLSFLYAVPQYDPYGCTISLKVGTNDVGPIVVLSPSEEFKTGGSDFVSPSDSPLLSLVVSCTAEQAAVVSVRFDDVAVVDTTRAACVQGQTTSVSPASAG